MFDRLEDSHASDERTRSWQVRCQSKEEVHEKERKDCCACDPAGRQQPGGGCRACEHRRQAWEEKVSGKSFCMGHRLAVPLLTTCCEEAGTEQHQLTLVLLLSSPQASLAGA